MTRFILILILSGLLGHSFAQNAATPYPFASKVVGEGPAIVLIPGLASSSDVWQATVDSLKLHHQCHLLTLAGFVDQPPLEGVENGFLPKVQQGIISYIKNELEEKPILVGHSLGGFLSMWIASSEPKLVKQVVIVDSYPFYSAGMNPTATEESSLGQATQFKQMMLNTPDSVFALQQKMSMPMLVSKADKIELATQWSLDSDRSTVAQAMFELMTTDLRDEVGQIACPVLVMGSWYAAKDYGITEEMVKGNYERQFEKAENVQVSMAPTAKHFIMWDQPEWFMNQLINFIK